MHLYTANTRKISVFMLLLMIQILNDANQTFVIYPLSGQRATHVDGSNNNNNLITLRSHECGINEKYTDI